MNNFEFLRKYYRLQHTIMFDDIVDLGFALVVYSKGDSSFFWNNALVGTLIDEKQLQQVEDKLESFKRKPAIYFENSNKLDSLMNFLREKGYKKGAEDSWQFWQGRDMDEKWFDSTKKVTNEKELNIYLKTFDKCYQKGDPQNPYGELGEYLQVAKEVWKKHFKNDRLEYFICYKNDKPVAVSTLTNFEGIGYISNVGSLREVRGEGFGKAATLYCVQESLKKGNKEACLATEEGKYPNEFYKRIGFSTRFKALAYIIK